MHFSQLINFPYHFHLVMLLLVQNQYFFQHLLLTFHFFQLGISYFLNCFPPHLLKLSFKNLYCVYIQVLKLSFKNLSCVCIQGLVLTADLSVPLCSLCRRPFPRDYLHTAEVREFFYYYNQCCGSGMLFIPDPNFFHPGPRIRIKEFQYFNPKNCF